MIDTLDKTVNQNAERLQALQQQRLIERQLQQTLSIKAGLLDPLLQLPAELPVLNKLGQTVWKEVAVEQGYRAIEREWLLLISAEQWQQILSTSPELASYSIAQTKLESLGLLLVKIQVPSQLDNMAELRQTLPIQLAPFVTRNYIYQSQQANESKSAHADQAKLTATSPEQLQLTLPQPRQDQAALPAVNGLPMCEQPITMGMIDTAISTEHVALPLSRKDFVLSQRNFLPDGVPISVSHGTAVAGILAGHSQQLTPLLPSLTLLSAGAFYAQNAYQQGATLDSILQALNWLVGEKVRVINMSLTGPDNPVLQQVVVRLSQQRTILVAAAGNGGPAAAPLYPAAYSDVIAVTAVDKDLGLYRWANQGDYIDFAAQGVKVLTTRADGSVGPESGTSMATPVVSAKVACMLAAKPELTLGQVMQQLQQQAVDLGGEGKDPQFGYGLISRP